MAIMRAGNEIVTLAPGERHLIAVALSVEMPRGLRGSPEVGRNLGRVPGAPHAAVELRTFVDRKRLLDDISIDARGGIEVDGRTFESALDLTLYGNSPRSDRAEDASRLTDRDALAMHVALDVTRDKQRTFSLEDELLARNGDVLAEHGRW